MKIFSHFYQKNLTFFKNQFFIFETLFYIFLDKKQINLIILSYDRIYNKWQVLINPDGFESCLQKSFIKIDRCYFRFVFKRSNTQLIWATSIWLAHLVAVEFATVFNLTISKFKTKTKTHPDICSIVHQMGLRLWIKWRNHYYKFYYDWRIFFWAW